MDVPAAVTQDVATFLLRCLPQFFSREGSSRSFPSSTVTSNFNIMFARLGTDYEIRNQWFFAILEAILQIDPFHSGSVMTALSRRSV